MTDQSVGLLNCLARVPEGPWKELSNYFAGAADAKPSAADYAFSVRKLYERLVEETGQDAELLRECLLLLVSEQQSLGLISKEHRELVDKLLAKPKPPARGRGRPIGAFGKAAHYERYELYQDWIREKARNPSLTQKQFVKKRLGITDAEFEKDFDLNDPDAEGPLHKKVAALLQDLKPARMRHSLDAEEREGLEQVYRLLVTKPQNLAQEWRKAKRYSPALTKEAFLRKFFDWPRDKETVDPSLIGVWLETLDQGEKLLTNSERG